jgi:hypothetical protein
MERQMDPEHHALRVPLGHTSLTREMHHVAHVSLGSFRQIQGRPPVTCVKMGLFRVPLGFHATTVVKAHTSHTWEAVCALYVMLDSLHFQGLLAALTLLSR